MLFGCLLLKLTQSCTKFAFLKGDKNSKGQKSIIPSIKYLDFTSSKNSYVCHHIDLYIQRNQNRNGENELFGTISLHKAVSTKIISRWLVHVLYLAGIDTSTFKGHSVRTAFTSKAKALGVPALEI